MRLPFLTVVLAAAFSIHASAQQPDYLVHTIKQKETLSGLAKQYHTTVGNIMRLNGMNSKSVLKIGQKIKIPSKQQEAAVSVIQPTAAAPAAPANKTQSTAAVQASTANVTHTVAKGETLYSIGKKYKVPVDQLKQWNGIYESGIKTGQVLVVGITPVVAGQQARPVQTPAAEKKQVNTDTVQKQVATAAKNNDVKPPISADTPPPAVDNKRPEEKTYMPGKPDYGSDAKKTASVNEEPVIAIPAGGFFATQYKKGTQETSGTAGTFKSASGWGDKKYYVLMNNIDINSIVKITVNNKSVYAKILGPLPEVKEDNGLLLRLSNSAAAELGISDAKFTVVVNY